MYKHLSVWFAVLAFAVLVVGIGTTAYAQTNHEAGTYSELVAAVSEAAAGDIITITSDIVVEQTITLNKAVTIYGNGYSVRVPKPGLHDSGIINTDLSSFGVFTTTASAGEVRIEHLKISGGAVSGGGIYITSGVTVYLDYVTITNCGGDSGSPGGGIYNSGTLYINNSTISRNAARYGGGFLNYGMMVVENSSFCENRSLSSSGGGGAGENQGELYINNCTFANNKSTELGGAINDYSGMAYIMNSTFAGNVTYHNSYTGGALRGDASVVVNCLFAYNYRLAGSDYVLNDFYRMPSGGSVSNYRAVSSITHAAGVTGYKSFLYQGAADGSDDSIFASGVSTKVLAADGSETGGGNVYQPMNYLPAGKYSSIDPLALSVEPYVYEGVPTVFDPYASTPVFAYQNEDGNWYKYASRSWTTTTVDLGKQVTTDQLGDARGDVIGATAYASSELYMVKLIYYPDTTHGTVHGVTVYGDVYQAGDQVTIITTPDKGYVFATKINIRQQS